jgi:Zn finger protein HypA/HybF involved in hydrogenase expression
VRKSDDVATWKALPFTGKPEEITCMSCPRKILIDPAWELPLLFKCQVCGAEWCQIRWGKAVTVKKE